MAAITTTTAMEETSYYISPMSDEKEGVLYIDKGKEGYVYVNYKFINKLEFTVLTMNSLLSDLKFKTPIKQISKLDVVPILRNLRDYIKSL